MVERGTEAKSFLLVDDERGFRKEKKAWLVELTRLQAEEILEAWDGKDALQILEENPQIRDVLCDMTMDGMDGLEFASQVFASKIKNLNAVFWSSDGFNSSAQLMLSAYIGKKDLCEMKPRTKGQFLEILQKHFSHLLKEAA